MSTTRRAAERGGGTRRWYEPLEGQSVEGLVQQRYEHMAKKKINVRRTTFSARKKPGGGANEGGEGSRVPVAAGSDSTTQRCHTLSLFHSLTHTSLSLSLSPLDMVV